MREQEPNHPAPTCCDQPMAKAAEDTVRIPAAKSDSPQSGMQDFRNKPR
jgi:hypothetical protein